ncbi:MAG TPA: hypothetical protein VLN09_11765 [Psychrobacter sp.]|jgi:hypothetical protein|uniref:hypothetical protein n=1 Tax=Psychrobacter sp. TaxID=56811 RepID=UPI002BFE0847|nr:hypothetical protein [Psychrobacter sp.]HSP86391.1 hypothetical protein [Psychrobacter sp.]
MKNIPFGITDWTIVEIKGENSTGHWKTRDFNNINVHMVEYSAGYIASKAIKIKMRI